MCDCVIRDRYAKETSYNIPNITVFLCKRRTLQLTLFTTKVNNNSGPNNSNARSPLSHILDSSKFNWAVRQSCDCVVEDRSTKETLHNFTKEFDYCTYLALK
jgi:hypothetical protein